MGKGRVIRWFLSLQPNLISILYGRCLFREYNFFSVVRIQRQRDVDRSQVVDPSHLYPKGEPASGSLPKHIYTHACACTRTHTHEQDKDGHKGGSECPHTVLSVSSRIQLCNYNPHL